VNEGARQWMGTEIIYLPAPRVVGVLFMPAIRQLARKSRADDAWVRDDCPPASSATDPPA
jgi:hypothetical protein